MGRPRRCGVRWGPRRHGKLVCRRLAGHHGNHAIRPTPRELALIYATPQRRRRRG